MTNQTSEEEERNKRQTMLCRRRSEIWQANHQIMQRKIYKKIKMSGISKQWLKPRRKTRKSSLKCCSEEGDQQNHIFCQARRKKNNMSMKNIKRLAKKNIISARYRGEPAAFSPTNSISLHMNNWLQ